MCREMHCYSAVKCIGGSSPCYQMLQPRTKELGEFFRLLVANITTAGDRRRHCYWRRSHRDLSVAGQQQIAVPSLRSQGHQTSRVAPGGIKPALLSSRRQVMSSKERLSRLLIPFATQPDHHFFPWHMRSSNAAVTVADVSPAALAKLKNWVMVLA